MYERERESWNKMGNLEGRECDGESVCVGIG